MAGNTSTPGTSVASRLLRMVAAFDERHRTLTLSELAGRASLPMATAHRLAAELVAGGASSPALHISRPTSKRPSVPIVSTVGSRLPMHCTGVGKVLLAHAPREVQDQVFANLTPITPYTITQPAVLSRQLEGVRREGLATTVEEMSLGACSLAVPIVRQSDDAVVAAIAVVVPSLKRGRQRLLGALQVAARGIVRLL